MLFCIIFQMSKDLQYGHVTEYDCYIHPAYQTFALLQFVTVAGDILHLEREVTFQ